MKFLFFDASGTILFERDDAESANVVHEEMSLQVLFPYNAGKVVLRGMRIGYKDALGVFQVYEIRKVKTYEPDHYQEVTAEHIAISELTDEFFADAEWTNITASAALSALLTNTLWSVGTSAVSNTSSANIANGNVWADIRTIEKSWNVRILPRVTVGSTGITGRYLDIIGADGTWRGMRLSLDKNADQIGVTWDDSKLKTALYAFGKSVKSTSGGSTTSTPLTFKDVVWTATASHPAKPANQTYLEDPAATAAYGRNGRPRFAYYQNGDISDPEVLLEKTWESLKTLNHPDVSIDCTVCDLYRLGYVDVPLRLYDTALIEIRPTNTVLTKQIIQYTEDLLDPTQSRVCIGTYVPNIIYIARETEKAAGGGGGGGGGQSDAEYERQEFETSIAYNEYQISLRATQYDLNQTNQNVAAAQAQVNINKTGITSLVTGTGAQLNADGTLVTDAQGNPVFVTTGNGLYSKIQQNASNISLVIQNGQINRAAIILAINGSGGSSATIAADNIDLQGYVTADTLETEIANLDAVYVEDLTAEGDISCANFTALSVTVDNTVSCGELDTDEITLNNHTFTNCIISASVSGNVLTLTPLEGNAITFSKATTLTGAWSSGVFTVDASPQGNTCVTSLTNTGHWGNTANNEDANTYYYKTYATINGGASPVDTGNSTTISGLGRYNAGVADGEAKFSLASVTLQGTTDSVYVEASSGGYDYYRAGSTKYSTATRYTSSGSLSRQFTGYAYKSDGTLASTSYGAWFCVSNINTTTIYLRNSSGDTVLVEDSSGSIIVADTSTKKHLLSTTRYKAGTTYSNTYYTKTS